MDVLFFRIYLCLERGEAGRKREKHQCVRETWISCILRSPTWDLARSPGTCPDWESNQRPFCLWDDAHPAEPHQSGLHKHILNMGDNGWRLFSTDYNVQSKIKQIPVISEHLKIGRKLTTTQSNHLKSLHNILASFLACAWTFFLMENLSHDNPLSWDCSTFRKFFIMSLKSPVLDQLFAAT